MLHVGPAREVLPHVALSATTTTKSRSQRPPQPLEVYDIRGARVSPDRLPQLASAGEGSSEAGS